jgi:hypothetical protein
VSRPTVADLVAHVRTWLPNANGHYRRYLDVVGKMSDEQIANVVRFASTPRGAEMAIVHAAKQQGY